MQVNLLLNLDVADVVQANFLLKQNVNGAVQSKLILRLKVTSVVQANLLLRLDVARAVQVKLHSADLPTKSFVMSLFLVTRFYRSTSAQMTSSNPRSSRSSATSP